MVSSFANRIGPADDGGSFDVQGVDVILQYAGPLLPNHLQTRWALRAPALPIFPSRGNGIL